MHRRWLAVLLSAGLATGAVVAAAARALADESPAVAVPGSIDLTAMRWTRDGQADDGARVVDGLAGPAVRLPCDGMGVRWAFRVSTAERATARLFLDWEPGPEGLLFELVVDGERLPPPRDGWRPTARHLVTDLGPRWLGEGEHLIELVAREDRRDGALVVRALELREP